jgi:hypothetical protein
MRLDDREGWKVRRRVSGTRANRGRTVRVALGLIVAAGLAGCDSGDLKRTLGLESRGPDEFRVVSRAPLDVPPDFGLRPPDPGAARPNELPVRDQAKQTVFGAPTTAPKLIAGRTPGESALLRQAGAGDIDNSIRATVNRESAQLANADRSLTDRLIFWQSTPPPGTPVDAAAEQKRLRENAALGKPATEGETPVIQRKRKGWLEGIF